MEVIEDDAESEQKSVPSSMQKLEEALIICQFGRFHIKLLLATLCAVVATTFVTTSSSYILPSAECDLSMSIMDKGVLNAVPFFGQVGAALFTGFLVDAFGRKVFLVSGHLGIFICSILEGTSQTYWMLLFGKAVEGIFLSLTFSATAGVVSEFTNRNVRDRVMLVYSALLALSLVIVALLSWALLPHQWNFIIIEGYFELHAWNIYFYVFSLWSLMATVLYYYLPESPKFLLSCGQETEALEVLRKIYSENTGNAEDTFPIKTLSLSGKQTQKSSSKKQMTRALFEMKELFKRPLLSKLLFFSAISFVCLLTYSALRMWFPQLSTIIENYKKDNGDTAQFCVMLDDYTQGLEPNLTVTSNLTVITECIPKLSGPETYMNGMLMGFITFLCIGISAFLVNSLGQKPLMFALMILCAACSSCLYWTNSSVQIAFLVSATCSFMQASLSLQHSILVRVFPTSVRILALSFVLMAGRIGSSVGNVLFPVMLQAGCMIPFLTLSAITLSVAGLIYFLPNPKKENKAGDQ